MESMGKFAQNSAERAQVRYLFGQANLVPLHKLVPRKPSKYRAVIHPLGLIRTQHLTRYSVTT